MNQSYHFTSLSDPDEDRVDPLAEPQLPVEGVDFVKRPKPDPLDKETDRQITLDHARAVTGGATKFDGSKAPIWQGVYNYFPHALVGLAWVSEYGMRKYGEWGGWKKLPNALPRYSDAHARHGLMQLVEGAYDITDSGLPHALQELWNAAARVELMIASGELVIMRGNEIVDGKPVLGTARPA